MGRALRPKRAGGASGRYGPGPRVSRVFSAFAAEKLNRARAALDVPLPAVIGAGLAGVGVPVAATAIPVARRLRRSVRQALENHGGASSAPKRRGRRRRPVAPRILLALSNVFRQPVRLGLTLLSLGLGGAMLMTAANVHRSLVAAVDRTLDARGDDIGSPTAIHYRGRRTAATVVGNIQEVAPPTAYVTPVGMARLTGFEDRAGAARLVLEPGANPMFVAPSMEEILAGNGRSPGYLMTRPELRKALVDHSVILGVVRVAIAALATAVGVGGLGTTLSLNVMERHREIGVLRAVGATPRQIQRLLMLEGLAIAGLSTALARVVSLPLTARVGWVVGRYGLHGTLPFAVSPGAVVFWFVVASTGALVACWIPSHRAAALPARALIAYDL